MTRLALAAAAGGLLVFGALAAGGVYLLRRDGFIY